MGASCFYEEAVRQRRLPTTFCAILDRRFARSCFHATAVLAHALRRRCAVHPGVRPAGLGQQQSHPRHRAFRGALRCAALPCGAQTVCTVLDTVAAQDLSLCCPSNFISLHCVPAATPIAVPLTFLCPSPSLVPLVWLVLIDKCRWFS